MYFSVSFTREPGAGFPDPRKTAIDPGEHLALGGLRRNFGPGMRMIEDGRKPEQEAPTWG